MIVVHLLIHCLWAAEQAQDTEIRPEKKETNYKEEYEKNIQALKDAKEKKLTKVKLPGVMRTRQQFYNERELREFLEQEKNAQPLEDQCNKTHNDKVSEQCVICHELFFSDLNEGSLFKQRVYKTHGYKILCVMCPNPNNCGGRMCCDCARECISVETKKLSYAEPVTYSDCKDAEISSKRIINCPVCRGYLNIEPMELETIPEDAKMEINEKINYIEDVVAGQDKKYWFLETIELNSHEFSVSKRQYDTVHDVVEAGKSSKNLLLNPTQVLLLEDLRVQFYFVNSCISTICKHFSDRIRPIKDFIKSCTEKIISPFIMTEFRERIIESNIPDAELDFYIERICSAVPIEHAENFTRIYYSMIIGYFEKTKDYNKNLQFIKKWMLSKYSFILTGFQHKSIVNIVEAAYYPRAEDFYTAFADALHDPRLINNIINCNALEFTFRGLSNYPQGALAAYENLITNLTEKYYNALKKENNYGMYKEIFVNRHNADVRRFSYTVYKNKLAEELGHIIISSDFNKPNSAYYMVDPPAFIYDAILKVLLTMAPSYFDGAVEKITDIAITKSSIVKCDENYADFLCETYKAKSSAKGVLITSIAEYIKKKQYPAAVLLFKNLPDAFATQEAINLFYKMKALPELLKRLNKYEFVNWENETAIYKLLKDQRKLSFLPALLKQMSKQPSCFFEVSSKDIDNYIVRYYLDNHNYESLGSVAFVCRNEKLLEAFRDDLDRILSNWDFALNLHKFYNGVISPEGTKNIFDLPFFKMYYAELFKWLDKKIDDKALKISRMLMVAKLALWDSTVKKKAEPKEGVSTGDVPNNMDSSSNAPIFTLEKDMLMAVGSTKVGFQAFCAFQCYLSSAFKKHLEEEIFPGVLAIEGADSTELLKESEYRGYYRKLLLLQKGLNIQEGMISCSEEEMRKLLEMLSVLKKIEESGALAAIKKKSDIKGDMTDIKYYTDAIAVLPKCACVIVQRFFRNASQNISSGRKRPFPYDA
ncbi:hypothetical protein ENBRE01_1562 [Enteropsectra breve]|nr:hypothetical protein ENBRE01_1562 [Enteropsectra breve]